MVDEYTYRNKLENPDRKNPVIRSLRMFVLAALFIWLAVGCSNGDDASIEVNKVLLVYLAGDNNLSGESHDKLRVIARGYDGAPHCRILIYKDSQDETACLYEADGKGSYTAIESYGKENSADAKVFARVITKAKMMYPGADFNLLVFSHASGWLPVGALAKPALRSVLVDGDNQMTITDFAAAIPERMFGLIAFDACHMAGVEVVYQLRNKAKYIIASSAEIVSPGFTPVYEKHVANLITGNYEHFIKEAFAYFDNNNGYMRSATLSIIKTEGLEDLAGFVKQHCDFKKEIQLNDIQYFDRGSGYLFCDFEDYYSRLLETKQQKQQLQSLINNCVIWKAATPSFLEGYNGFSITAHSGMTGYIPQKRYKQMNEAYKNLVWSKWLSDISEQ